MTTLSVILPDDVQEFVDNQVQAGAFEDAPAYLLHLLHEDRKRKAGEHLDTLLLEGIESGEATPMTQKDWEDLRNGLKQHIEQTSNRVAQTGEGGAAS